MAQAELGIHTLDIKHRISRIEAKDIKTIFGLKINQQLKTTAFYNKGINQIEIIENGYPDGNGGFKTSYVLVLQVNPSHMLNISKYKILPATQRNISKMIGKLTTILSNDFHLSLSNHDSGNWKIDRIDFAFDIKVCNAPIMIRILNHALKVNNKRCFRSVFKVAFPERIIYQSVRFENSSYRYNIYDKLRQLSDEKYPLTPMEQAYFNNIIRIEKQIFDKGVNNCIGTPKYLSLLQNKTVIEKVKNDMLRELRLFFGTGKHVTYQIATQAIKNSNFDTATQNQMIQTIVFIAKYGMDKAREEIRCHAVQNKIDTRTELKKFDTLLQDIESLGISSSGILSQESIQINTNTLSNINDLLPAYNSKLKKVRKKSPFGKIYIDKTNHRYKCNFTIHPLGKGSDRESYADANRDRLEDRIFCKLIEVYRNNLLSLVSSHSSYQSKIIQKFRQDIINFGKVARCSEIQKRIRIELFHTQMEEIL